MRPLQSVQRRTGFETLKAKKLFAADLTGGAAIDLPDTASVTGFEHGDVRFPYVLGYREGGENAVVGDSLMIGDHNLGGQEGEDFHESAFDSRAGSILQQNGVGLEGPLGKSMTAQPFPGEDVTGNATTVVGGFKSVFGLDACTYK
jgi:hypothetical protein